MSKIPYKFLPIPEEFLSDDFIDDPAMMRLIRWIFKRISTQKTEIPLKKQKRLLELEPFEFMFGRDSCSIETGVSTKKIQVRINQLIGLGYLTKVESKTVSTFTVYSISFGKKPVSKMVSNFTSDILSTKSFNKNNGQQNGQHHGQHVGQQVDHNLEEEKKRSKKDHHPNPSSKVLPIRDDDEMMTDDFSSIEDNNKNLQHNIYYPSIPLTQTTQEVISGIFLTQNELDACIKLKGSLEKVKEAIEAIQASKKRKYDITDWPNTLANWKIPNKAKVIVEDNISYADKLCKAFPEFINGNGWRCYMYTDKVKDQKGLLFEPQNSYLQAVFVSLNDGEFKQKCFNTLKEKKMPISKPKAELSKA